MLVKLFICLILSVRGRYNLLGGIVRTDMVANGVVAAAKNLGVSIPIIARLEGTNVEEGRRVLSESGIGIIPAQGMNDAAEKVVAAAAG